MIPYIILSFSRGVPLGFIICHDLIKQELKTETLHIGKRERIASFMRQGSNLLRLVDRHVFCGIWCRCSFKIRQSQAYR